MMRPLLLFATLAAALLSSSPAHAALLPGSCPKAEVSQPFLPWLDVMHYVAAPDGGVEAGAEGWTLDGAQVVAGNEPWQVGGADHARSLAIPAGGSATTPVMCAGLDRPTLRFFARRTGGSAPLLKVEVLSGGLDTVAVIGAGGNWQPTLPLPIASGLLPSLLGDQSRVAFRFTAVGGSFQVDDVYVDPYGRY